jgi:hypothetical protein
LSAFDPTTGYVTLAVLVAIEALRLPGLWRRAKARPQSGKP